MLSTRDPPQKKGHIQTISEGLEKKYFTQMETKRKEESQYSYQIKDFKIKVVKRQRRTLHNDQRINSRRRYNNYKYICTQHMSTAICKANANEYERGNY